MKLRIRTMIDKNYIILSSLVKDKIDSVSLDELGMMGFNPEFVTFRKREKGKEYCSCYDIGYEMTSSNLINIRRLYPSDWKLFLPAVKGL